MGRGRKKQSRGLGDVVENIAEVTGIKKLVGNDCGCEERKNKLNELLSFRLKVVNCPNEEQISWYKDFEKIRTLTITDSQRKKICELHASIFNVPYYEPCVNCSPKPYIKMIENLDKVFKDYENN